MEGIIEDVTDRDVKKGCVYYMPHHAIQRPDKTTTKLRVVFDASSKINGNSLNDVLKTGPNLLTPLFDILVKFRKHKVVLLADIKQAFLQIEIDEKHRDFLRFLWFKNPFDKNPELCIYRYCRVVFGVKASPFLLNATIKHHLQNYKNEFARKIESSLYVDDLTCGEEDELKAFDLYKNAKYMFKEGGLELRKWESKTPKR